MDVKNAFGEILAPKTGRQVGEIASWIAASAFSEGANNYFAIMDVIDIKIGYTSMTFTENVNDVSSKFAYRRKRLWREGFYIGQKPKIYSIHQERQNNVIYRNNAFLRMNYRKKSNASFLKQHFLNS